MEEVSAASVAAMQERIKALEKQIDKQDKMILNMERIAVSVKNMQEDVKEVKSDIATLKAKPGKNWDDVLKAIIAAVVGGFVAYAFTQLGA